jgi:hypothetical protein
LIEGYAVFEFKYLPVIADTAEARAARLSIWDSCIMAVVLCLDFCGYRYEGLCSVVVKT